MRAKKFGVLLLVFVLGLATVIACISAGKTKPVQAASDMLRLTGANGIVIECDHNMYDLAKQLLPEMEKRIRDNALRAEQMKAKASVLKNNHEAIQAFINSEIGVTNPKGNTSSLMLNTMSDGLIDFLVGPTKSITHLRIYDSKALKERLANGEKIDGFYYDPSTNMLVTISSPVICSKVIINGQEIKNDSSELDVTNMLIEPGDLENEMKQALTQLDGTVRVNGSVALTSINSSIRQAVQSAIQSNYDINPSRRWFYEGMTNYLTARCLDRFFGRDAADEFLRQYDPAPYQELKDQVDLRKWPSGLDIHITSIDPDKLGFDLSQIRPGDNIELSIKQFTDKLQQDIKQNLGEFVGDARLHQAACCFVTSEICGLADRYGASAITAIFKEIGKAGEPTEQTIIDAIRKVTGEDFNMILGQYGSKAKEIKTQPSPETIDGIRA